ncbi:MAG TPA: hypothetical protein VMR52_13835 [Dehalococcoidia bacterium]|nr:hypothetical protein [Dehalococcoidia bacterium]
MADEAAVHAALIELFGVANAPLTLPQRVQRSAPVLNRIGMTIEQLIDTIRQPDLSWNAERAKALGVTPAVWQDALTAAGLEAVYDLAMLLDVMHRAEAASAMLRAGYVPSTDVEGKLNWVRA